MKILKCPNCYARLQELDRGSWACPKCFSTFWTIEEWKEAWNVLTDRQRES